MTKITEGMIVTLSNVGDDVSNMATNITAHRAISEEKINVLSRCEFSTYIHYVLSFSLSIELLYYTHTHTHYIYVLLTHVHNITIIISIIMVLFVFFYYYL